MRTSGKQDSANVQQFYLTHLLIPLLLVLPLLWLMRRYAIDGWVTQLWYDPVSGTFPVRDSFFLEYVLHRWAKIAVQAMGLAALALYGLSFFMQAIRPYRRIMLFFVLTMSLPAVTVSYLKAVSNQLCPWSLQDYGGSTAAQAPLFSTPLAGKQPGKCWPAGHAAAGFSLLAPYFVFYQASRFGLASCALVTGLLFGNLLGFGRVMQGAHFLSHQIWSALICWLIMLVFYELLLRRPAARQIRAQIASRSLEGA